jgi:ABC-type transporter Mla subunit MlaD
MSGRVDAVQWADALTAATSEELAATLTSLAGLARDLADQAGLLDVMVAQVSETPAPDVQAATSRATAELHAAAGALYAVAGQVRP